MNSILTIKAYAVKSFFNFWGRMGGFLLNTGCYKDVELFRDLAYGSAAEQRLDIHRPSSVAAGSLPVLVFFHGGGWISADKRIYDGIAATFARQGYLTFNVNYRLAPASRFPAQLQDAASAIEWIERNLAVYGGDGTTIVLGGDSAGAQLAAWYACALQEPGLFSRAGMASSSARMPLKGLLLFYGVYDFDTVVDARFPFIKIYAESFLGSDREVYAANSEIASPIKHVSPGLPPVFLCAGERDGLYTQTLAFAERVEKAGVSCRKLLLSSDYRADHGFLFFRALRASKLAFSEADGFLRSLTGSASAGTAGK